MYIYKVQIYGKEIPVMVANGYVLSHRTYSKTEVYGDKDNIKSRTYSYIEIWIKLDDNKEQVFTFPSGRIQVRDSQRLSLLVTQKGEVAAILNHNSKNWDYPEDRSLFTIQKQQSGCLLWTFIGILITGLLYYFANKLNLNLNNWRDIAIVASPFVILLAYSYYINAKAEQHVEDVLYPQIEKIFNLELNRKYD